MAARREGSSFDWAEEVEAMHLQARESKGHPSVPHFGLPQQPVPILGDQRQLFPALFEGDVTEDPNMYIRPKIRKTALLCWHGASNLVGPDAFVHKNICLYRGR